MQNIIERAAIFAIEAHSGMTRKRTRNPYILHPFEAATIASTMTEDQSIIAAALLHDVVEDTSVSIETIEELFGKRIRDLVASETENKREELPPEETWMTRKRESLQDLKDGDEGVKILWISDKLSNIRAIYREFRLLGDAIWDNFHQKDKNMQAWYYKTIAENVEELAHHAAYEEYVSLVEKIFD